MNIYRPFAKPQAMTFDLDDTFYDNWPYILQAEQRLQAFIQAQYPQAASLTTAHWLSFKAQALHDFPEIRFDMGKLRMATLRLGLSSAGYADAELAAATEACFTHFYAARSDFTVAPAVCDVLQTLSAQIPLVAITNGNVDVDRIGIGQYFSAVFHANIDMRAKPHPDMFSAALTHLALPAARVMHVGDNAYNDIWGAQKIGMSTAWYAADRPMQIQREPFRALPNIQLTNLQELTTLI
jgi:putative hydrolase of the HAD superfamily